MDYKVVTEDSRFRLEKKVKEWIANGWVPTGGVAFTFHSGYKETWAQAMVKDKYSERHMELIIKEYDLGDASVSIVVTPADHPQGAQCYMEIVRLLSNGDTFLDRASGNYKNARMLSEALRDAIGYGPARDLLRAHGVEDSSPLMYLGVHN